MRSNLNFQSRLCLSQAISLSLRVHTGVAEISMPCREAMRIKRENVPGLVHRKFAVKSSYLKSPLQGILGEKEWKKSLSYFKHEALQRKNLKVADSFMFPKFDKTPFLQLHFKIVFRFVYIFIFSAEQRLPNYHFIQIL